MKKLIRFSLRELRETTKPLLLSHVESRLATLSKRSVDAQNERNRNMERNEIDLSRLNQESLAYIAHALNRSRRD